MVQPLWKTEWQFLKKNWNYNIYDPVTPLVGKFYVSVFYHH